MLENCPHLKGFSSATAYDKGCFSIHSLACLPMGFLFQLELQKKLHYSSVKWMGFAHFSLLSSSVSLH